VSAEGAQHGEDSPVLRPIGAFLMPQPIRILSIAAFQITRSHREPRTEEDRELDEQWGDDAMIVSAEGAQHGEDSPVLRPIGAFLMPQPIRISSSDPCARGHPEHRGLPDHSLPPRAAHRGGPRAR
jgi:hypothetical protein